VESGIDAGARVVAEASAVLKKDNPMNYLKRLVVVAALLTVGLAQVATSFGATKGGHVNAAIEFINAKQYEQAAAELTKAIAENPKSASLYDNRAAMYFNLQKYPEALADYTKAIALNPKDPHSYCNRGTVYRATNMLPEAIADFTKAIELKPDEISYYEARLYIYDSENDSEKALGDLTHLIGQARFSHRNTRKRQDGFDRRCEAGVASPRLDRMASQLPSLLSREWTSKFADMRRLRFQRGEN